MIVDIDVGNSRIKWRTLCAGVVSGRGVDTEFNDGVAKAIRCQGSPARIRLSNVGDESVWQQIENVARQWDCPVQRAITTARAGGVVCGYDVPSTMGVDRWLALLAAWQHCRGSCVVVDAGSAITVDLLGAGGVHQGGYIVPGLSLMRQSLLGGTAGVRVGNEIEVCVKPGRSTQQAVVHGGLLMVRSLVEGAVSQLTANLPVKIVVTGGDGELLVPLLKGDVCYIGDLVMDGLDVLFP
ncbi:type III pantothenate kinase [Porticoccus sp.]